VYRGGVAESGWTFLSNHAHVLLCLARRPTLTLRDVALQVGITERAVQRIVADLEDGGYLRRHKVGRQNEYFIDERKALRHPVEAHQTIATLIALGDDGAGPERRRAPASKRRRA
jgi:predicted ArsR family transcriptional regulator